MKIAFYKAFCDDATWIDNAIGIATIGSYSHVEGIFEDGSWFSISPRENQARFKKIEHKPENWTVIDLPMSKKTEAKLRQLCEEMTAMEYSYLGAALSVTPFCLVRENKTFCSRLWAELLYEAGLPVNRPCSYSPSELHGALVQFIHYKIVTRIG